MGVCVCVFNDKFWSDVDISLNRYMYCGFFLIVAAVCVFKDKFWSYVDISLNGYMYCSFFVSHGAVQLCSSWPCCATASDSSVRVLALCRGDGDVTPAHSGVHVSRLSPVWAALRWHRPMDRTDFAAMSARWDRQRRRDRQAAERHCRGDRSSFVLQHTRSSLV